MIMPIAVIVAKIIANNNEARAKGARITTVVCNKNNRIVIINTL